MPALKLAMASRDAAGRPQPGSGLCGKPIERDALYWEHEGNAAVRVGDLKLVRAGRNSAWELYDLAKTARNSTISPPRSPRRPRSWRSWEAWAERAQVLPYPKAPLVGGKGPTRKARKAQAAAAAVEKP